MRSWCGAGEKSVTARPPTECVGEEGRSRAGYQYHDYCDNPQNWICKSKHNDQDQPQQDQDIPEAFRVLLGEFRDFVVQPGYPLNNSDNSVAECRQNFKRYRIFFAFFLLREQRVFNRFSQPAVRFAQRR